MHNDSSAANAPVYTTPSSLAPVSEPTPATATSTGQDTEGNSFGNVCELTRPDNGMFNRTQAEHAVRVAEILGHLRDFGKIKDLMTSYWPVSQSAVLPEALIMLGVPALEQTMNATSGGMNEQDELQRWAKAILNSTSSRILVNAVLDWQDFMSLFTGSNLRLEYLGLVFTIVARSYLFGLAKDGARDRTFVQDMYQCGTTCLQLARELTPVNDMTVWLALDHGILTSIVEGDCSKSFSR